MNKNLHGKSSLSKLIRTQSHADKQEEEEEEKKRTSDFEP